MFGKFISLSLLSCLVCVANHEAKAQELRFQRQQALNFNRQPQQQAESGQAGGAQTLVVTQNPDGQGIRVIDRSTNRQLVDTSQLNEVELLDNVNEREELNAGLVSGLIDWLDKLKEKKKQKKRGKKNDEPPLILPIKPERHERKEIHIHINNHIKKQPHKKHGQHHKGGHYEDYHDGHHEHHDHDKHYHGKHNYPLLGHHFDWGFDTYGHDQHWGGGHGHSHDDYSSYESKPVAKYASAAATKAARQAGGVETSRRPSANANNRRSSSITNLASRMGTGARSASLSEALAS